VVARWRCPAAATGTCGLLGWCMTGQCDICRVEFLTVAGLKRCSCDCHKDAA
jgi:hypothetical protein